MRTFHCTCGNTIFFDNSVCLSCGKEVGFCPACDEMTTLVPQADGKLRCGHDDHCGAELVKCFNYSAHNVCNRCLTAEDATAPEPLCDCCRFNDTIPDLSVPGNAKKWYALEAAKRRLFYGLNMLHLPYGAKGDGIEPPLSFDFKADVIPAGDFWRSVGKGEKVYTGHANGCITINIREADEVEREKLRVDLGEAQRTLIGHFRHEVGHYFWDVLVKDRCEDKCIAAFGDHNKPTYAESLDRHYKEGPPADWQLNFISAYATMHPWEDFAETWAAYLDMVSVLDTAHNAGFVDREFMHGANVEKMIEHYQELGIALNEFNRTMGLLDIVPEVFVPPVVEKLKFVHELIQSARDYKPLPAAPAEQVPAEPAAAAPPVANAQAPVVQNHPVSGAPASPAANNPPAPSPSPEINAPAEAPEPVAISAS